MDAALAPSGYRISNSGEKILEIVSGIEGRTKITISDSLEILDKHLPRYGSWIHSSFL